jgi:hypothetical protein
MIKLKIHRFKTSEKWCAWIPDPKGGFQFLKSGKFSYWIFYGNDWLAQIEKVTNSEGGGWMLWYPRNANKRNLCPRFKTLIEAAIEAKKLFEKGRKRSKAVAD